MAVVNMQYVSIMGKCADMERILREYVTRYPIELFSAAGALKGVKGAEARAVFDPHAEEFATIRKYLDAPPEGGGVISAGEAAERVRAFDARMEEISKEEEAVRAELRERKVKKEALMPFLGLGVDFAGLSGLEFLHYRYGRMPALNVKKVQDAGYEGYVLVPLEKGEHAIKCLYFCEKAEAKKIDALFAAMQFDRLPVPEELSGSVEEAIRSESDAIRAAEAKKEELRARREALLSGEKASLEEAYRALSEEDTLCRIRRLAAYVEDECFLLTGWMTQKDAAKLRTSCRGDKAVILNEESAREAKKAGKKPPTLLKNNFLFRHFEMFVKMYGMPTAGEIDPTPFVAITYAFLFGMMFGDLGQGLLLTVGGWIVYRWKKADLAAILSVCGLFSMFFGWMYGSFFGFEDTIVKTHWLSPSRSGDIMHLLLISVGLGAAIIMMSMLIHIINAVRAHRRGELLFDTNGVAGLIFYGMSVLLAAPPVAGMFGIPMGKLLRIDGTVIAVIAVLCILSVWFREPLGRWLQKEKDGEEKSSPGMFLLESFFELFEIMLSYVTNSVSFVRVGAFALSHAGMMSVVHMLAGVKEGHLTGSPVTAAIVMVLGNLLVMGIEGLVVGIQVLRLEFYEIFSRFYSGDGEEFKPNTLVK